MEVEYLVLQAVLNSVGKPRRVDRSGRSYWVADAVLIVPGVLPGSQGPLYYPPEEVELSTDAWNGMPVVVNHPVHNDNPVSARHPAVLDRWGIGEVYGAKFTDRLTAQAWIEEERCLRVEPSVIHALEKNETVELSTGLSLKKKAAPEGSVHNAVAYQFTTYGYRPDHLAILPDGRGACAVDDGCGLNVRNKVSHDQLRNRLSELLHKQYKSSLDPYDSSVYVVDVYDKEVIFTHDDKLWRVKYNLDLRDDQVSLSDGGAEEVRRTISYKPVNTADPTNNQEIPMDPKEKSKIVTFLTTNCACWKIKGSDKVLNDLPDEQLQSLYRKAQDDQHRDEIQNAATKEWKDSVGTTHVWDAATKTWQSKPAETKKEDPVQNKDDKGKQDPPRKKTKEEWLADAPDEVKEVFNTAAESQKIERERLLDEITSNIQDGNAKATARVQFQGKSIAELRAISSLIPKKIPINNGLPPHYGLAPGAPNSVDDTVFNEDEDLLVPGEHIGVGSGHDDNDD